MTELWCKLWNFILNTMNSALEGIGMLLETVGEVLVDVFGSILEGVSDALGISPLTLAFLGLGAYLLLMPGSEERDKATETSQSLDREVRSYNV